MTVLHSVPATAYLKVIRSHVLARHTVVTARPGLCSIRCKLTALTSLFDHRLENNAVAGGSLVHVVKRPQIEQHWAMTRPSVC
ncbi:hypothetical protein ALQ26_200074 [Pseudomonas amygdali pv. lachrymans]|nr:hypothetical protein ALQ26_200074 [Pseudomonas amygdali pv. lachrymans]